jgi:hypothetical protein
MATISTVCLKGGILSALRAAGELLLWLTARTIFSLAREKREIQTKGLRAVFGPGRAHIYQKSARRHFLLPFTRPVKGVWNLSIAFLQIVNFAVRVCERESVHAIIQPRKKCPSIVNIISLWKSYFFYWTTESPLLVVLLNVATKSGEIVYPRVHPYKIGRNKIWAFFLVVAACMRGDKLNWELNRSERGDQSPSAAVARRLMRKPDRRGKAEKLLTDQEE